MIYLYDLVGKINNGETEITVDNMHESITIPPRGDKNIILKHFDDCMVESIIVTYSYANRCAHTHIYVSGDYKA